MGKVTEIVEEAEPFELPPPEPEELNHWLLNEQFHDDTKKLAKFRIRLIQNRHQRKKEIGPLRKLFQENIWAIRKFDEKDVKYLTDKEKLELFKEVFQFEANLPILIQHVKKIIALRRDAWWIKYDRKEYLSHHYAWGPVPLPVLPGNLDPEDCLPIFAKSRILMKMTKEEAERVNSYLNILP